MNSILIKGPNYFKSLIECKAREILRETLTERCCSHTLQKSNYENNQMVESLFVDAAL